MSALYDCQNPRCVDGDAYRAEVSRLQARWDARDKALRALIEKWRGEAPRTGLSYGAWSAGDAMVWCDSQRACADELERAIGDSDA